MELEREEMQTLRDVLKRGLPGPHLSTTQVIVVLDAVQSLERLIDNYDEDRHVATSDRISAQ